MAILCLSGNLSICGKDVMEGQSAVIRQGQDEGKMVARATSENACFAIIGTQSSSASSEKKILDRDHFWKVTAMEKQFAYMMAMFDHKKQQEEKEEEEFDLF